MSEVGNLQRAVVRSIQLTSARVHESLFRLDNKFGVELKTKRAVHSSDP